MGYKYASEYLFKEIDEESNKDTRYGEDWCRNFFDNGRRYKKFSFFDSSFFSELIDDLQNNPDCQYVSYINDLVRSGYTPKWIRAMEKPPCVSSLGIIEVVASRLLNTMDCPTTYETIVEKKCKSLSGEDIGIQKRVLSVDFDYDNEDQNFYNLSKFDYDFFSNNFTALETGIKHIIYDVYQKKYLVSDKFRNEDANKVLEDFAYSYLIRKFILEDKDYKFRNIGLIVDKKNQRLKFAPNFDFEFVLDAKISANILCDIDESLKYQLDNNWAIRNELKYIKIKYPKVFEKFINTIKLIKKPSHNGSVLDGVFDKIVPQDEGEQKVYELSKRAIEHNIDNVLNISANLDNCSTNEL